MTQYDGPTGLSSGERPTDYDLKEGVHAPGFFVRRRMLLWLSTLTASALFYESPTTLLHAQSSSEKAHTPLPGDGPPVQSHVGEVGWEDFIKNGVPVVQQLYQDSSPRGQDAYLYTLANWAARLRPDAVPRGKVYRFASLTSPVHFGVVYRGAPFFLVEWCLEPGAILPPHNHPNASVCTLGLEGEARIRNFEIVGDAPAFTSKDVFRVRETHSEIMSPGRINSLSTTRDNIHTFQAGKAGARGVDISTMHGEDKGFSFLQIEDKPGDTENRIFEATWRKI